MKQEVWQAEAALFPPFHHVGCQSLFAPPCSVSWTPECSLAHCASSHIHGASSRSAGGLLSIPA